MIQATSSLANNAFEEKRQAARRPLFCKVQLMFARQAVEARALDVSTGGLAVIADLNAQIGQTCTARFSLSAPDGTCRDLALQASVLHSVLTHDGFRLGLQFMQPDASAKQLLKRFVDSA